LGGEVSDPVSEDQGESSRDCRRIAEFEMVPNVKNPPPPTSPRLGEGAVFLFSLENGLIFGSILISQGNPQIWVFFWEIS
jgi:hypothetical protein